MAKERMQDVQAKERSLSPKVLGWREAIDAYVQEVWPQVVSDIAALVAVPSVEDLSLAAPGAPWGPGPREALTQALAIAERLGLKAVDADGYLGFGEVKGKDDMVIATIAHADVVPADPAGWATNPYELVRREGYLIGRGVDDDKGPLVLSLWAAHFFARQAEQPRHTLRAIIGANEETGMADVPEYLARYGEPAFLFTPDAEFPVCNGEKGLYQGTFACTRSAGGRIVRFHGGEAPNAIPAIAEAVVRVPLAELPLANSIEFEALDEATTRLIAHGKAGHASRPAGTINAIGLLTNYLLENGFFSEAEQPFLELQQRIFADDYGQALGIAADDGRFDPLTCIGGTVRTEEDRFLQTVDSRYVTTTSAQKITERLCAVAAEYGCTFESGLADPPFYIDPQTPEIQVLITTYNEHRGTQAKPFTIGGGTYARHFARGVSFGPEMPGEVLPAWAGTIHGPDETVSEATLKAALAIYIDAIGRLMELD